MNIIFFGTPGFSVPSLQALLAMPGVRVGAVVTQPDRPSGRGGAIRPSPIKELAAQQGIPVLQPTSLRKELPAFLASASAYGPFDIGVVIAFGQILPKAVLDLPRRGCVNIHASLLPRWRGAAPIQRAIAAGDGETGICLMAMDEGLDTGAVYSRERVRITEADTAHALHDTLAALGASLLVRDLSAIVAGSLHAVPQPADGVTYAAKIEAAEGKIDWSRPAPEVARMIRALSPHPGSYTLWRGTRLKVLDAQAQSTPVSPANTPGTVLSTTQGSLTVACGSGAVAISHLQLAGKKQMSADEFLRGTVVSPGERLSDSV